MKGAIAVYVVRIYFDGGVANLRSLEIPTWEKSSKGTSFLKLVPPEDPSIYGTYTEMAGMPILREHVRFWTYKEQKDSVVKDGVNEQEKLEGRFLYWLGNFKDEFDRGPTFAEVRNFLSMGQKRSGDFTRDLNERGLINHRKVGRTAEYTLTKPGIVYGDELLEKYPEIAKEEQ